MHAAVIGLGSQYDLGRHHATVYNARPEITRISMCDINRAAAEKVAATIGKPVTVHTDIKAMFAAGGIDLVSILTPDQFHREHAEIALAAKAHVLLTKPIAPTLDDARAIVQAHRRSGVQMMIAHEMRYRSIYPRAKELIASGRLGDIALLNITELYQAVRQKFANAPWYAAKESGRTMITGSGVHQVDMIRWLAGRPVSAVTAQGNMVGDIPYWHNKTVTATLQFEGMPALGQLTFSYEGMPEMTRGGLIVIGSKGMISNGRFRDRASGAIEELQRPGEIDSHQTVTHAFLDALRDRTPMPITPEDAFHSVSTALAIDAACETGKPTQPARA